MDHAVNSLKLKFRKRTWLNEETLLRNFRAITRCEEKIESPAYNIQNPFSVKLTPDSSHLVTEISLQKPCLLYIYWGPVITEFFSEIQKPWMDILEALKMGTWLKDHTLTIDRAIQFDTGRHTKKFTRPAGITGAKLGFRPRSRYSAVIITAIEDLLAGENSPNLQIVAMFTVIHVQDSICNNESHIMYQYLKTSDDCITTLQPLFVSSSHQDSETGNADSGGDTSANIGNQTVNGNHSNMQTTPEQCSCDTESEKEKQTETRLNNDLNNCKTECVVCQHNVVTIAILPCRHTCVCDCCLQKLDDKCPMCRGYISSYFRIQEYGDETSYEHSSRRSSGEDLAHSNESRWEYINRRLNEFFGFQ